MQIRTGLFFAALVGAVMGATLEARAHEMVEQEPRDATLADSSGNDIVLSHFRGKPVVVFYEDKQSVELNRPLKKALWERGKALDLVSAAHVVAIANLRRYNFFPARPIALSYVRDEEKRVGVPILVDLEGTLSAAPWNLPAKTSSVLLMDDEGRVRYAYSGQMSQREMDTFFEQLSALVGVELREK